MSPAAQRKSDDAPKVEQTQIGDRTGQDRKVPVSDLDKDLAQANEDVADYLNAHAIKQGAYVEDVEESEQNKPGNVEVEDHSAELSAQEVADGAVEDKPKDKKKS